MQMTAFEVIDSGALATRWAVPESWVREQSRPPTLSLTYDSASTFVSSG
jgi:hypothetical protein